MGLYELKMYIKRLPIASSVIKKYKAAKEYRLDISKRKLLQEYGTKLAQTVEEALTETGLEFFLSFGSLLGIIREKKFLAHDNDIDYCVFIDKPEQWNLLEKHLTAHGLKKIKQFTLNNVVTEQAYSLNGLSVDFFGCSRDDKHIYSHTYFRKYGYIYNSRWQQHVADLILYKFDSVKIIEVSGAKYHVPSDPEKFLVSVYTENWVRPANGWKPDDSPAWHEIPDTLGWVEYLQ